MKKILIILLLLSFTSQAKEFGASIGLNVADVSSKGTSSETESFSSKPSFMFDLNYNYEIDEKFMLIGLLGYSTNKTKVKDSGSTPFEGTAVFSYFKIGGLLKFVLNEHVSLYGGASYGFSDKAEIDVDTSSTGVSATIDYKKLSQYKVNDRASVTIGIGGQRDLKDITIRPRLMYEIGLNSAIELNSNNYEASFNTLSAVVDILFY